MSNIDTNKLRAKNTSKGLDAQELRIRVEEDGKGGIYLEEIHELLDRIEAAEKERDDVMQQLIRSEADKQSISEAHKAVTSRLSSLADENVALRAKIEKMERQEPVVTLHDDGYFTWVASRPYESDFAGWRMKVYALPGAKGEEK